MIVDDQEMPALGVAAVRGADRRIENASLGAQGIGSGRIRRIVLVV